MCTVSTALAAGQSVMGYYGATQQAEAQAEAQAQATTAERARSIAETRNIRLRQGQQRDSLAKEMEEGARRANQARATVTTSAAEAGISGRAADLVAQDVNVQYARYNRSLQNQRSENDFASDLQAENAVMRSQQNLQRINQPINKPSPLSLIGNLIGGVAEASTREMQYEQATGQKLTLGNLLFGYEDDKSTTLAKSAATTAASSSTSAAAAKAVPIYASQDYQSYSPLADDAYPMPEGDGIISGSLLPNRQ